MIKKSVCQSTDTAYSRSWDMYNDFMRRVGINTSERFSSTTMELWIAELSRNGKSHGSILTHISGIRHRCKGRGIDASTLDSPRVKLMMKGIKRVSAKGDKKPCLAMTHSELQKLCCITETLDSFMHNSLTAMLAMAFYGFLRPSEYCISPAKHTLCWGDVKYGKSRRAIQLEFKTYKHSHTQATVTLTAMPGDITCPVEAMLRYRRSQRGRNKDTTLFKFTTEEFRAHFNSLCVRAGVRTQLTPHSLRRGGVTWATKAGWPDARIKAHGRWKSNAYMGYVRSQ